MQDFIAYSPSSKNALHILQISSSLPVNILIFGEEGTGKILLAKKVFPDASVFQANELETLVKNLKINLTSYKIIILKDIDTLSNKVQFLEKLKHIKIIATSIHQYSDLKNNFAVKIQLENFLNRKEDLQNLLKIYIKEANTIYQTNILQKDIKIDLSKNAITLKQSVYKDIFIKSMNKIEIQEALYHFSIKRLKEDGMSYKMFIEFIDVPLLKSVKKLYKSQVQMAKALDINRITLRKKISLCFKDENV